MRITRDGFYLRVEIIPGFVLGLLALEYAASDRQGSGRQTPAARGITGCHGLAAKVKKANVVRAHRLGKSTGRAMKFVGQRMPGVLVG